MPLLTTDGLDYNDLKQAPFDNQKSKSSINTTSLDFMFFKMGPFVGEVISSSSSGGTLVTYTPRNYAILIY